MRIWVIQHPNKGVFTGFNYNTQGKWMPKFRWSIPLDEGIAFYSLQLAKEKLNEINNHVNGCEITEIR